ncbi:polyhydroxybutyrate depolymerase [candidate division WOR-3 bacterium]|uniref:Polyhydroxybutyrate depolymerase n=1 Tax=candidate division WOR-3 bacterium TaxID=2052148 RepID=A0A9D5QCH0_UNCW3|nr:polyhydroxybutyrate depolymerase [candidate division WOR-3 bacterium]MBD3364544.1 polyhydroxybutyrate depolymerase [candidate division WOR-3 bacterium]
MRKRVLPALLACLVCFLGVIKDLQAKDRRYKFEFDDVRRTYRVHIPPAYSDSTPAPLVLSLHGFAASARIHRYMTKMNRKSNEEGFICVYPNGTGWPRAWNAGNKLGKRKQADDLGFLNSLIDTMVSRYSIDTNMIYATGFSNGGMMSHRLACQLSSRIAAIAPVAGGLVYGECEPERPVPVIHIHARNDPVVKYEGDTIAGVHFYSIQENLENWAELNWCEEGPDTVFNENSRAWRQRWRDAESDMEVMLWTTRRGGHTWPRGRGFPIPSLAFPSRAVDANEVMWEFFVDHPMKTKDRFHGDPDENRDEQDLRSIQSPE